MTGAPMSPERMERLQALFELALEQPAENLTAFLAAQAPGDPQLQSDVLELLRVHHSGRQLTGRSPASRPDPVDPPVSRVGPWSITRLIGSGGMGSVYEAVRADDQFSKRVAVKFLHRGAHDEIAVARRASSEILASVATHGPIMHQFKAAANDVVLRRESAFADHESAHRAAAENLRRIARRFADQEEINAAAVRLD